MHMKKKFHSLHCQVARYVSWNEFVHQMLAHGEVEELIVRPDLDIVTIILHEGAVIKGKKVLFHFLLIHAKLLYCV